MLTLKVDHGAYQVVAEKLHDEGGVLVALLGKGVELCIRVSVVCVIPWAAHTGNSVVESLLGELASLVRGVQDLVVEHGEVQRKTEADGVSGGQAASSDLRGSLVRLERLVGRSLALVAHGELGKVAVVVTLPVKEVSLRALAAVIGSGTYILW